MNSDIHSLLTCLYFYVIFVVCTASEIIRVQQTYRILCNRSQRPRPIEWDRLVSKLHRNSEYRSRRSALISSLDTSGATDNCPVLAQSCRTSSVRIVIFLAPTRSAWRVY